MAGSTIQIRGFYHGLLLAASLILLLTANLVGQTLPPAEEVINAAKSLHVPNFEYQVDVVQTAEILQSGTTLSAGPTREGNAKFVPGVGIKNVRDEESKSGETTPTPAIMVDLGRFLDEMLSYPQLTMEITEIAGRPHYRIEGRAKDNMRACTIWIDSGNNSVSAIDVFLLQKPFAEIKVEYTESQSGFWLPSKIDLAHATDGSHVTLEFTDYQFAE